MGWWDGVWLDLVVGLDQIGGTLPSFDELIYGRFLRPVNEFFRLVFVVTFFPYLVVDMEGKVSGDGEAEVDEWWRWTW